MKTHLPTPRREFDPAEFAIVIALAFGLSIVGSLAMALSYTGREIVFDDVGLWGTVGYEAIFGAIIWMILRSRGWVWSDFAVHPSKGSTLLGGILAAGIVVFDLVFEAVVGKVPVSLQAGLLSVLVVSIVNPLFEELLVLAYVVQAVRPRFGLTTAMNVSLALRLVYHLYQGPMAVIPIAFFGVVMTVVYVRMGRLWPAIVAHAILDFVALAGWV